MVKFLPCSYITLCALAITLLILLKYYGQIRSNKLIYDTEKGNKINKEYLKNNKRLKIGS